MEELEENNKEEKVKSALLSLVGVEYESEDDQVQYMVPPQIYKSIRNHAICGALAAAASVIPAIGTIAFMIVLWHAYYKMTKVSGLRFDASLLKNIGLGILINFLFSLFFTPLVDGTALLEIGFVATLGYIQITYSCLLYLKSLSFVHNRKGNMENAHFVEVDFSVLWKDRLNEQVIWAYKRANPSANEVELQQKLSMLDSNTDYRRLRKLSLAMDQYYLSPIIGSFVPILGDFITSAPSFVLYSIAGYKTLKSKELGISLLYNEMKGMFWSVIPLIGDVADCEEKSYIKNYLLLSGYAIGNQKIIDQVKRDVKHFTVMIIVYFVLFVLVAAIAIYLIYAIVQYVQELAVGLFS